MFTNEMKRYLLYILCLTTLVSLPLNAASEKSASEKDINVREIILSEITDSYEWHITTWGNKPISVPLPVIVHSKTSGWHIFMSSKFEEQPVYKGFYIAKEGKYKDKIVEIDENGKEVRPLDISLTKTATALIFNSVLLIILIMSIAHYYKKDGIFPKKGFVILMEMLIMDIYEGVIKPSIGKDYRRYAPYLLTVFFFIFLNNLMGLIPFFPFGATVTGNIAITLTLALCTLLIVNFSGTKEYWKEIFWPEVPAWLKVPVPLMPAVEFIGIFTKPFALMIRLFANIVGGHSIVGGLVCLVFVTVKLGTTINITMSALSVIFTVFIDLIELLIAYIQAYIFTMLSAVFIGLARVEPSHKPVTKETVKQV